MSAAYSAEGSGAVGVACPVCVMAGRGIPLTVLVTYSIVVFFCVSSEITVCTLQKKGSSQTKSILSQLKTQRHLFGYREDNDKIFRRTIRTGIN